MDIVDFGMEGTQALSAKVLRTQAVDGFIPGQQRARIKVRQVSDLGTRYPTVVVIQDEKVVYNAWQGTGSYDIIWNGKDFYGDDLEPKTYLVKLLKHGDFRALGAKSRNADLHISQVPVPAPPPILLGELLYFGAVILYYEVLEIQKRNRMYPSATSSSKTLAQATTKTKPPEGDVAVLIKDIGEPQGFLISDPVAVVELSPTVRVPGTPGYGFIPPYRTALAIGGIARFYKIPAGGWTANLNPIRPVNRSFLLPAFVQFTLGPGEQKTVVILTKVIK